MALADTASEKLLVRESRFHAFRVKRDLVARLREYLETLWAARSDSSACTEIHRFRFHSLHVCDPFLREAAFAPSIYPRIRDFLGGPALLVQSSFLYKPPGGRGHGEHTDNQYVRVAGARSCAVWIALDDTTKQNGCVYLNTSSGVTYLEGDAGSAFIWDGDQLHGSLSNMSDHARRSLAFHYVGAGATYVAEHLRPMFDEFGRKHVVGVS